MTKKRTSGLLGYECQASTTKLVNTYVLNELTKILQTCLTLVLDEGWSAKKREATWSPRPRAASRLGDGYGKGPNHPPPPLPVLRLLSRPLSTSVSTTHTLLYVIGVSNKTVKNAMWLPECLLIARCASLSFISCVRTVFCVRTVVRELRPPWLRRSPYEHE